jgi:hypothetical protein
LIVNDSYMSMVLPDSIAERILDFIAGKRSFPFVCRDELMCLMYIYGKYNKVCNDEIAEAGSLAHRTAAQMDQDIDIYINSSAGKLDPEYIRSKYINRELQLAVERKSIGKSMIANDPMILSDCFAQHVAFYKQHYFFELYGPLKDQELTSDIRSILSCRMVMVCYNKEDAVSTGLVHPLIPVYVWFRDQIGAKP